MGRTKGSKNHITVRNKLTNSSYSAEVQYTRLSLVDKLICYYYYIFCKTEGQQGFDTEKSGYKAHYDQLVPIHSTYSNTQFYSRGKTFAELAQDLIHDNVEVEEPIYPGIPPLSSRPQGTHFLCTPSPAKRKSAPTPSQLQSPPMPLNLNKKPKATTPASIMKPRTERNISIEELNDSAKRLGLDDHRLEGISVPILRGSWKKKIRQDDMEGGFTTTKKEFNLIRLLPHSSISLKQCELIWLNPRQLRLGMVWPKWFKSAKQQVAFQTAGSAHKFDEDHDVIDSLQDDINRKQEIKKDTKKTRVVDYAIFEFELPQDMSKANTEITILLVTLKADDLDVDEVLAPGAQEKVLQIITQQKMEGDEENLLDVTQRDVNLGKSDPDGKKAGNDVDMNVVNRLIDFYNARWGLVSDKNAVIAFLKPFVGREETVLQLVILLCKYGEKSTDWVAHLMKAYPEGKEDEMHAFVVNAFAEKAAEAEEKAAAATAAAATTVPDIVTTMVTDDNDDLSESPSITLPPPRSPEAGPRLQLTGGPPAVIEATTAMDTREKMAKRRREVPLTRAQSLRNVESSGN